MSILFNRESCRLENEEPAIFRDLNLDQIVGAITAKRDEYDLCPFFYTPLDDVGTISFRHDVFRDLENTGLLQHIKHFAERLRTMRSHLVQSGKLRHHAQTRRICFDRWSIGQ